MGKKDDVERFLANANRGDHAANDEPVREQDPRPPADGQRGN